MAPNTSQTDCAACKPPGYTDKTGERQCSVCNAGYYAVFRDALDGNFSTCRLCPAGVDCAAGAGPTILAGFYGVIDSMTLALQTFRCEGARCVEKGACGSNRAPAWENPLCGRCAEGFSEWVGECVACSGVNVWLVLGLLLLGWLCVLAVHVFAQRSSSGSELRIALLFWQVALLIIEDASWARWASFLGLNFLTASGGASCPFPVSPQEMVLVLQLGPLLPFALLLLTATCHRYLALPASKRSALGVRVPAFDWAAYFRTTISLYLFTFNSVTRHCLEFFNCTELPAGRFMTSLPTMRCDSGTYRTLMPLAALLLAVYALLVPSCIALKLHTARAGGQLQSEEHLRWWGVVYGPFRERALWWGLSQMIFRLLLVGVAVLMWAQNAARLGALSLLCAASLILLMLIKPNREAVDNHWELLILTALHVLAISRTMAAPDAWLALLTLGTGVSVIARLFVGPFVKRCQPPPEPAREPGMVPNSNEVPDGWCPGLGGTEPSNCKSASHMADCIVATRDTHTVLLPTSASTAGPPATPDRTISWIMSAYRAGSDRSRASRSGLDLEPAIELPQLAPSGSAALAGTELEAKAGLGEPESDLTPQVIPPGWEEHFLDGKSRVGLDVEVNAARGRWNTLLSSHRDPD